MRASIEHARDEILALAYCIYSIFCLERRRRRRRRRERRERRERRHDWSKTNPDVVKAPPNASPPTRSQVLTSLLMLHRLSASAHLLTSLEPTIPSSCASCSRLRSSQQKRFASNAKKRRVPWRAPSTQLKENRARRRRNDEDLIDEQNERKRLEGYLSKLTLYRDRLHTLRRDKLISIPPERFMQLCEDTKAFRQAVETGEAQSNDMYIAYRFLRNIPSSKLKARAFDILYEAAATGDPNSVLSLVDRALRQDLLTAGTLRSAPVLKAIQQLQKLGDEEEGTRYLERATEMAKASDEAFATTKVLKSATLDSLTSPWNELGLLYLRRRQFREAFNAFKTGVDLDDPQSYYYQAQLDFITARRQYTSRWLYNVTKAAASGHFKAAYDLGMFYAESPPLQPTKSPEEPNSKAEELPGASEILANSSSLLSRILGYLPTSLQPRIIQDASSQASMDHFASWPKTPQERVILADAWLTIAAKYWYLPAYVHALLSWVFAGENLLQSLQAKDQETYEQKSVVVNSHGSKVGSWNMFPEVPESWANDYEKLQAEAKAIADAMGIDVRTQDGCLLYRHQGPRGDGLNELDI
ncbi:hypothetical protein H2203_006313 [Taxawa tesnikishii (nom. ined.)]|nr:hypothetical protein H2203_006313 [Dothideales sp. JES 119]